MANAFGIVAVAAMRPVSSAMEGVAAMRVNRLGRTFVAEIEGVDLSRPMTAAAFKPIRAAFLDHSVLVFRGQDLTRAALVAFSRHFGELLIHVLNQYLAGDVPEVMRLSNTDESGKRVVFRNGAEAWHTDLSFTDRPSLATLLYGEAIPPEGGDTLFCDGYAAFEALDARMNRRIDGMKAVHSFSRYQRNRFPERPLTDAQRAKTPDVAHPVVRVHPETGRKALFIGDDVISHVEGMDRMEGKALMDELLRHATEDRFVYRHRWRCGDLVVYDNRCTLHRATEYDQEKHVRTLLRTSIKGTPTSLAVA